MAERTYVYTAATLRLRIATQQTNDFRYKWSTGYRVDVDADGVEEAYFLKVVSCLRPDIFRLIWRTLC